MSKILPQLLKISIILLFVLLVANGRNLFSKPGGENGENRATQNAALAARDYCQDSANQRTGKEDCYAKKFQEIAEAAGPEFSFKILDNLQRADPKAIGCHLIAHGIGLGSYKREPNNWRTLIQNMNPSCSYGAIHGVLESYIGSLPDKSLKKEIIPTICGKAPRADCNHIVGHLLLVQTDADVGRALDLCEVFASPMQNNFCISGVFMEYQTALNLVAHELVPESWLNWPPRLGELEKLCRSYDDKYAEGCWEEIVHVALVVFRNDPKKIFDFCGTAQVPEGVKKCRRHSIGIIGASRNFNLADLKNVCIPQKDDLDFERECYPTLVSSALSTIPSAVPESVAFCGILQDEFQPACFSMVGMMAHSSPVIKDLLPSACRAAPAEYRKYCLGEASLGEPIYRNFND